MNYSELEDAIVKELQTRIQRGIVGTNLVSTLYQQFTEESHKHTEAVERTNKTFKGLAAVFGVEYENSYDFSTMLENTKKFKEKIESLVDTEKPKQRYLCYSYSDDCGHTHCTVITDKDMTHVDCALDDDNALEHLYYADNNLLTEISKTTGLSEEALLDLEEAQLCKKIKKFFENLINDENVSIAQFSEHLEGLLDDSRHNGKAKSWVVI